MLSVSALYAAISIIVAVIIIIPSASERLLPIFDGLPRMSASIFLHRQLWAHKQSITSMPARWRRQ